MGVLLTGECVGDLHSSLDLAPLVTDSCQWWDQRLGLHGFLECLIRVQVRGHLALRALRLVIVGDELLRLVGTFVVATPKVKVVSV